MQNSDLGRYKRPDIFINEIDKFIVELPVQQTLINLVPGFSKQGPVNNPIYITNETDFKNMFGEIDRNLERKGSYFHRTCLKMLESGPIWALNLLKTNDERDKIHYKSFSSSAGYDNDMDLIMPYSRIFNRQDFWKRDDESFLDYVQFQNNNKKEQLFHITNLSSRKSTTFIYKSNVTGFDIKAEDWYGGPTKVPHYLNRNDWISDYMVSMLVIEGDWTNYTQLSSDPKWSQYFDKTGLKKDTIQDFVNETTVNSLFFRDMSLIPNFRDLERRDMYIKNIVNQNTNRTGIFLTYNEDLLYDFDYPTKIMDLIGNSLVNSDKNTIDFLSYKEDLEEIKNYQLTPLDQLGNSFGNYGTDLTAPLNIGGEYLDSRTAGYTKWYVHDMSMNIDDLKIVINPNGYFNIGENESIDIEDQTITLNDSETPRIDVLYFSEDDGYVKVLEGVEGSGNPNFTYDYNNHIILGYIEVDSGTTSYSGVTVEENGEYISLDISLSAVNGVFRMLFNNTVGLTNLSNYYQIRQRAAFNYMLNKLSNRKGVIINQVDGSKYYIENINSINYSVSQNAQIWIMMDEYDETQIETKFITPEHFLLIYFLDNEIYYLTTDDINGFSSTNEAYEEPYGIIGKYSTLYLDYYNGIINNGDHFDVGDETYYLRMYNLDGYIQIDFLTEDDIPSSLKLEENIDITSHISNFKQTLDISHFVGDTFETIYEVHVDASRYTNVKRGDFLEAYFDETEYEFGAEKFGTEPKRMTRINKTMAHPNNPSIKILTTDDPINISSFEISGVTETIYQTMVHPQVEKYVSTYKGIALTGFNISKESMPDGSESRLNSILNVIAKTTNLTKGLVNKNKISWRYLVDSFGLGLTEKSKQQLVDLCGKKLNCLGFINAPSAKTFKKSLNPSFINDDDLTLDIELLANGGDESKNPSFLYSFADGVGRSCVGYFFPYLEVSDVGGDAPMMMPPAAHVATTYMNKFITTKPGIEPWTVCAGVDDGRILGIRDVEIDFSDEDLEKLYAVNLNPIVKKAGAGFCINSESTAQIFPYSSLSLIHSREVLIELENAMYDMLLRYQWKFNTPEIRGEIKYKADNICKDIQKRDGLYAYRNVMDESNNTNYIISLQMGVIDTFIENIKSMGIIVNNITILAKGQIDSGGFM